MMSAHQFHSLLNHPLVHAIVSWLTARSPWVVMMKTGSAILLAALAGGIAIGVAIPLNGGKVDLMFDSSGGTPALLTWSAGVLGLLLVAIGAFFHFLRARREERETERKRVFVMEQRGLRDTSDTPLVAAVPPGLKGRREQLLVDLRERLHDNRITSPEVALEKLISRVKELQNRRREFPPEDISVVYGGLSPVPFTFLAGVLFDDEDRLTIMDWDRDRTGWRSLDGMDDGVRFSEPDLSEVPENAPEVVLALSVSYKINMGAVKSTFGSTPVVTLDLPDGNTESHWSELKQQELAKAFRHLVSELGNRGAKQLHLCIAAQNSLVFRLGRSYDVRNHPPATVYQYEPTNSPPHPWGVRLPTHGIRNPLIVFRNQISSTVIARQ